MKIALGVSGGIAAYKAAEICRLLQDRGVRVQVVMTDAAQQFVRPLTFAALTGEKVITGLWNSDGGEPNLESSVEHIGVAQSIDALLIAPATADLLARFAQGIANDFLTTLYLATKVGVVVAPAMNVNMWEHPATRSNIAILRERGVVVVEPDEGHLACGMVGAGRLAANDRIVEAVLSVLDATTRAAERGRDLAGETVLVTAGPTREPIDPVRFLGNRSSGKMGFAVAEAARERGARVVVIAGAATACPPAGVEVVRVERTEQMRAAVLTRLPEATIVVKAAAVADYRPKQVADQKVKRKGPMTLELEPTADILAEVSARRTSQQVIIGFAAETDEVLERARQKVASKAVDAIVANDVSDERIGFDSDENEVTILTRDGEQHVARASKRAIAERVLDMALALRKAIPVV